MVFGFRPTLRLILVKRDRLNATVINLIYPGRHHEYLCLCISVFVRKPVIERIPREAFVRAVFVA